jgi:type IV secretion system protein VirB10
MDQLQRLQNPSQANGATLQGGGQQQGASANAQGPVGNNLSGANTPKAIAAKTIDENRIISKGAQIDCALTTRVVTDISGFASCIVTSNVYSANGRTLLIERMSEVQGEYGASGQPGQRRVFVLWTRIRMPRGVTIDLNSPSTDSLGAAGMDGLIDNRWWERIGSAYMLSFYKDIMAYEIAKNTNTNTSGGATVLQNTTQTSSSLAEKVLAQSINIKPTLYANQGDRVAIYVARDLEFKEVYDVVKSKREQ